MNNRIKARHKYRGARERRQERISTPEWAVYRDLVRAARAINRAANSMATAIMRSFLSIVHISAYYREKRSQCRE